MHLRTGTSMRCQSMRLISKRCISMLYRNRSISVLITEAWSVPPYQYAR